MIQRIDINGTGDPLLLVGLDGTEARDKGEL